MQRIALYSFDGVSSFSEGLEEKMGTIKFEAERYSGPLNYYLASISRASADKKYLDPLVFNLGKDSSSAAQELLQYSPPAKRIVQASSDSVDKDKEQGSKSQDFVKHYSAEASLDESLANSHQVEVTA